MDDAFLLDPIDEISEELFICDVCNYHTDIDAVHQSCPYCGSKVYDESECCYEDDAS